MRVDLCGPSRKNLVLGFPVLQVKVTAIIFLLQYFNSYRFFFNYYHTGSLLPIISTLDAYKEALAHSYYDCVKVNG